MAIQMQLQFCTWEFVLTSGELGIPVRVDFYPLRTGGYSWKVYIRQAQAADGNTWDMPSPQLAENFGLKAVINPTDYQMTLVG